MEKELTQKDKEILEELKEWFADEYNQLFHTQDEIVGTLDKVLKL